MTAMTETAPQTPQTAAEAVPAATMHSGRLETGGAELYYEIRGRGPALLMISGAGGDAGYYTGVADLLADAFTVITYDRRGNSRSTGRVARPMTITEQAADAHTLISQVAGGQALVFGNSGGAIIGLALAAEHPESLSGLIAHEPPVVNVLPDAQHWQSLFSDIAAASAVEGVGVAGEKFVRLIRGEGSYPWPPGVMQRFAGNLEHLFTVEFPGFTDYVIDEAALTAAPFPIVLGAGSADRGLYYARPSIVLAQRTGRPWAEFPGIHLEFMRHPDRFAAALRALATQMITSVPRIPEQWQHDTHELRPL